MLLLVCFIVVLIFAAIIVYALYQRREVRAGLKIPGASFFFEAKGSADEPVNRVKSLK
jgi:hypothetical protein